MADDGILSETSLLTMEAWVQSQASLYGIYGGQLFHQWTICLHLCHQYYKILPTDSGVQ